MKIYSALIVIAVLIAFVSGYFLISQTSSTAIEKLYTATVEQIKSDFKETHKPQHIIDLQNLFARSAYPDLTSIQASLPHTQQYSFTDIKNLYQYQKTCSTKDPTPNIPQNLSKAWQWAEFHCKKEATLPDDFLETGPYVNPWGKSYAYLMFSSDSLTEENKRNSISKALPYFHILEYPWLAQNKFLSNPIQILLAGLSQKGLQNLLNKDSLVFSKDHVFLLALDQSTEDIDTITSPYYYVYSKAMWDQFVTQQIKYLKTNILENEEICDIAQGNVCWAIERGAFQLFIKKYIMVFFLGSILLIALLIWVVLQKIKADKLEEERKRFALQTLTHELRTPISGLTLSIDELRDEFDRMSPPGQDAFGRMCGDIARLKRLTEASRQYLTLSSKKTFIQFQKRELNSINEFIESVLEPYLDKITLNLSQPDSSLNCDPYWLSICLKNLVENSLHHGKAPVQADVISKSDHILFSIADAGHELDASLKDLIAPFIKGSQSQGIGLGLNLVNRIVSEMGGELGLTTKPTCFTIKLKKEKNHDKNTPC